MFKRKISSCNTSPGHNVGSDAQEDASPCPHYKSVTADDRDEAAKAGEWQRYTAFIVAAAVSVLLYIPLMSTL